MKPAINLEERIGKTVGRRVMPSDAFAYAMQLQKTAGQLARSFDLPPMPRGVFKFQSHEEADAWLTKYRSQRKAS